MVGPPGLDPGTKGLTVPDSLCLCIGKFKNPKCFSGGPISWWHRPTSDRIRSDPSMRTLEYLYLKDDEAQRVVILWRPNLSRTDDSATPGEWGASAGAGACPHRNLPRAGHCGPEVGTLAPEPEFTGLLGAGQDLGVPTGGRETENLKNWKSDILPGHPTRQDFRISGFQDFRFSLATVRHLRVGAGSQSAIMNVCIGVQIGHWQTVTSAHVMVSCTS